MESGIGGGLRGGWGHAAARPPPAAPEPSAPGAGGRGVPAPAQNGKRGSRQEGTAESGWGRAGRASPRTGVRPAWSPRCLSLTKLRRGLAHFRVSGAILGAPSTSGHAAGRGIWGRGVVRGGTISGGSWLLRPLRGWDSKAADSNPDPTNYRSDLGSWLTLASLSFLLCNMSIEPTSPTSRPLH